MDQSRIWMRLTDIFREVFDDDSLDVTPSLSARDVDRNKLVVDHYARLGFTKVAEMQSGITCWELQVKLAEIVRAPLTVASHGFAEARENSPA